MSEPEMTRCPTCGSQVRTVTGSEGTSHFAPMEQVPMMPLPAYEAEVGKLAKALNQLRHEQFMNLHGLDGGAHSGRWENLGDTFQEAWRKAAGRLWEILEAMRDA